MREGHTHFVRIDRMSGEASPPRGGGAYRWAAPAKPARQPVEQVKRGGYIFVPMYYDSTPKPSMQGVIRLYREGDIPEAERTRAYDAKLVIREHAGRVKRPPPDASATPAKQEAPANDEAPDDEAKPKG